MPLLKLSSKFMSHTFANGYIFGVIFHGSSFGKLTQAIIYLAVTVFTLQIRLCSWDLYNELLFEDCCL